MQTLMGTSDRVLMSLAILKVNMDERWFDSIENFVPFVAEGLRLSAHSAVSLINLQSILADEFGIEIPQSALKTILARASKRGLVRVSDGIYHRNDANLDSYSLIKVRQQILRQHEQLISKLVDYGSRNFSIEWTSDEAENALLAYFRNHSLQLLSEVVNGHPSVPIETTSKGFQFVVAAFIKSISEGDAENFEYLEAIVKGSMLADALLYPEMGQLAESFQGVSVYFDTEFLIRVLNLEGEQLRSPCLELLSMLREAGAELRCFDHTVDELRGILEYAANVLQRSDLSNPSSSGVLEHYIVRKQKASDVRFDIARLDQSLRRLGIIPTSLPKYTSSLTVDEIRLAEVLQHRVGYQRENALEHDKKSLAAIHRLRRGQSSTRLERCHAIFVTTNNALVRASKTFFGSEGLSDPTCVPHCQNLDLFTTMVWLKRPLGSPNLPRKRIIADCYAALNPSDRLWRKYLSEIVRLFERGDIGKEDYDLLRLSNDARMALMDITLGDEDVFAEGTVDQVLQRAYDNARSDIEADRDATLARLASEERAHTKTSHDADMVKQQLHEVEQARIADRKRVESHAHEMSQKLARIVFMGVRLVVFAALVVVVFLTMPTSLPWQSGTWQSYLGPGAAGFAALAIAMLTILNLLNGLTLLGIVDRCERWLARLIEGWMRRSLIYSGDDQVVAKEVHEKH